MPRQKSETESAALSFILTLSASLGTFGFFAVQGILLARILGPAGRGVFAACVVFPQALLYVGLLGASELFAGFAAEGMHRARLRRSAFLYGLTAGVVSLLLCVVLDIFSIPADVQHALPLAIFCALTMPFQQIRLSVLAVDHGTRNLTRYNKSRLIAAAAFPALLLLSFSFGLFEQQPSWGHNSLESPQTEVGNLSYVRSDLVLACWLFVLAHSSCFLLIQWGMTESWVGPRAVPVIAALKKAKGLIGAWLSTELLERLDMVLILVLFANEELMGYYATAVPIAALMIIVPNAAGIYAFNRGARKEENLTLAEVWRFMGIGLIIQTASGLALALSLPFLIPLVYGSAFSPSVEFAWLLIPAGAFRGLLQAADSYLRARKNPGLGLIARLCAIPILLIGSFMLAPSLGASAVPLSLTVAQMVCFTIVAAGVIHDSSRNATMEPPSVHTT